MLKVYVMSTEYDEEDTLLGDGNIVQGELRNEVIEFNELISSLVNTVSAGVKEQSKLTIEMSGDIKLKGGAKAGLKIFTFNIFSAKGEIEKTNSMKLILETTIAPK
jgi:hypothetical protein